MDHQHNLLESLSPWEDFFTPDQYQTDSMPFTSYQPQFIKQELQGYPMISKEADQISLPDDQIEPLPEFPESQSVSLEDLMTIEPFSPKKEDNGELKKDVFTFDLDELHTSSPLSEAVDENPQEMSPPATPSQNQSSKRGRRKRMSLAPEERKLRRREQNRLAAQRSRERKRAVNAKTSTEFHKLIAANSQLQEEIDSLRNEKERMENMWCQHMHICPLLATSGVN